MKRYLITTPDNPYNPFEEPDKWFVWDLSHGYNTSAKLANLAKTNRYMLDAAEQRVINDAVNDMIRLHPPGMYIRIEVNED